MDIRKAFILFYFIFNEICLVEERRETANHGKLGVEAWIDAKFELRWDASAGCVRSAGHGRELIWDAAVAG
jgi:hypothetical protein